MSALTAMPIARPVSALRPDGRSTDTTGWLAAFIDKIAFS